MTRTHIMANSLPFERALRARVEEWEARSNLNRFWSGDSTLWTGGDEGEWLGWLHIAESQLNTLEKLASLAPPRLSEFEHLLLLGMGGASV